MSFKTLLFPLQPSPVGQAALTRTVEFAKSIGADLIGVGARAPVYLTDPWLISGDILTRLAEDDEAALKAAEDCFRDAAAGLGERAHWRVRRDFPNTAMNLEAAGADLIVAPMEKGPEASTIKLSDLILESGLPVMVLPNPAPAIRAERILIAWRNTADARRAVTTALPLLQTAAEVVVLQIVRTEDAEDAWPGLHAVTDRLLRQGVKAKAEMVRQGDHADAAALLAEAEARAVDLIVLGGYGHTRAREWILGGMTHDLLSTTTLPLFMVH